MMYTHTSVHRYISVHVVLMYDDLKDFSANVPLVQAKKKKNGFCLHRSATSFMDRYCQLSLVCNVLKDRADRVERIET